jgi:hypothetical protein
MTYQTAADFDFSHYPDEKLFSIREFVGENGPAQRDAWQAEVRRRKEAKRQAEERLEQERAAKRNAVKDVIAYSESLASEICGLISAGELLLTICDKDNMPTIRRVNSWLKEHIDFKALYDDAIKDRLTIFEEQLISISDSMENDFKEVTRNGHTRRVVDPEVIARAKLRVDSRYKYLRAYKPERWVEVSTLNVKNGDSGFDPQNMSQDDLEKTIADLEKKSGIARK